MKLANTFTLKILPPFTIGLSSFSRKIRRSRFVVLPVNWKRHFDTSIGTEELGHLEMVGSLVSQLTHGASAKEFDTAGVGAYYIDHSNAVYPASAGGVPWNAAGMQSKGDSIADIMEDMAAEQKARATYDNILKMSDDPDVSRVIQFLRAREIIHFQRFGEVLNNLQSQMKKKRVY